MRVGGRGDVTETHRLWKISRGSNIPSPVYHKGRQLYGLYRGRDAMRRKGEVLVVEGYFDVIALQIAGFENVVATCGTAMTEEHALLLKRYARKVLFLFDQDKAGMQATWKGMAQILPLGLSGAVVRLPQGDDPDSFLQREGQQAFQACLEEARPVLEVYQEQLLDWFAQYVLENGSTNGEEHTDDD